jgi:hypothetical protein
VSRSFPPQFDSELEREFQQRYYRNVRRTLRLVIVVLVLLFLGYAARTYTDRQPLSFVIGQNGPPLLLFLLIFGLTSVSWFERVWQPVIVALSWIAMAVTLHVQAARMADMAQNPHPGASFENTA